MNSKIFYFLLLFVFGFLLITPNTNAEGDKKDSQKLSKVQGTPVRAFLNVNNISTVIKNTGISDIDRDESNSGLVFPKGSGKAAVFTSGLLWGAKITGDPQVRVGGAAYREGLQGGRILNSGLPYEQLLAEDENAAHIRVYRVRPDVYPGGPKADFTSEIRDNEGSEAQIRAQYETDWNEWPAQYGAPFLDNNGNGTYEPSSDVPGVTGADQTIWFVANDLNSGRTKNLYGAVPLGVEMQATFWAYNRTGALGNMFFRKYKIVNKSNEVFNDMYVSMWSDVDLGNSTDDFAGCDTTLSLGYCYNANAIDATYNPLPPPAIGFDFFQGPLLDGVAGEDKNKNGVDDALDYAIFEGKLVGPGKINLPMTAFYYFARGDANVTDPTQGSPEGSSQFYNFFQGRIGKTGEFFVDPSTGAATTFALTGDPVSKKGWYDGQLIGASDRRIGQASGPFNMAPGDVQEVVVAEIAAGALPGVDRLSAIGLLKFYDRSAQDAFDNFFDLPTAPPAPEVNIPGKFDPAMNAYYALDRKIVLDWGENLAKVQQTESYDSKGYKFEGYNIYQLPNASASVEEGKRIATFDIANNVLKIEGQFFDISTGVVATKVQQFGNDTGIKRYFEITSDALNGGTPLINGIRYYFAVTSYAYNPDATLTNLENPIKIFTIIPTSTAPGQVYSNIAGDTLEVEHTAGVSEGLAIPIVVDPTMLTGDTYKVTFGTQTVVTVDDEGEQHEEEITFWNITNVTKNKVVIQNQLNQTGDDDYATIDGILIKVTGPPAPGMKSWDIPNGARRWTWAGGADGFGLEGFEHAIGNAFGNWFSSSTVGYDKLKNVLLKLAPTDTDGNLTNPADPNVSFGYRYLRFATAAASKPEFAQFIINPTAGYAFQDFVKNKPFAAFDVESTPPRRLAIGHLENNVAGGLVDGKYWPPDYNVGDNVAGSGPREWFFIYDTDYSETQDPALAIDILNNITPMIWFGTPARRGNVAFSAGDEFLILANHINTPNDVFTFTAPQPTYNADQAKVDVEKINVFPNPYYGVNSEELNKYNRFVTFTHLPAQAKIRIFNFAGVLVRTIEKSDISTYQRWNLANDFGLPVASGLYIAHIDMPELGKTKILKIAVIQEQQILDRF